MDIFDIDDAVRFVRQRIGNDVEIPDGDVQEIIEMVLDYFEDFGFLDVDCEEDDPEPEVVANHIRSVILESIPDYAFTDKIGEIVEAEYLYEESISL